MSERRDLKKYTKPCMMNIGPGIWGLKLCNTVDAYVPAKLLTLKIPLKSGTFEDWVAKRFNSLPAAVKSCPDFNTFSKETHKILKAAVDIS